MFGNKLPLHAHAIVTMRLANTLVKIHTHFQTLLCQLAFRSSIGDRPEERNSFWLLLLVCWRGAYTQFQIFWPEERTRNSTAFS